MKIVFIIGFYPSIKGGAEYQSKIIAENLRDQYGHNITFISYGHRQDKKEILDGFNVYQIEVRQNISNKWGLYADLCSRMESIILHESPDLVYQRVLNTITYRLSGITRKHNIPFIVHIADRYSIEFTKNLKGIIKKQLFNKIMSNKPGLIVQTWEQQKLLSDHKVYPSLQIYNFHPGTGGGGKSARKEGNIYWIGTFRRVKQVEIFLDLAESFRMQSEIKFVIIGRTEPDDYGKELYKRILNLSNVRYMGEIANEEINSLLESDACCLVNTSLSEGFSNTFIQAWQRGIPVISLNADPDGIMTTHGAGLMCNGSLHQLRSHILNIRNVETLYNTLSENARRLCEDLFSIEPNMHILEEYMIKFAKKKYDT